MNQDDIVQPPIQFPGGPSIADRSIASESLASELSKYPIRFGCLSHTNGGADTARVWTTCTVTPSQIQFQGWISHFETGEPDFQRDYASHVRNIHDATNLKENLETLQRALIALAYGREHPMGGTQRPDDELDQLAAGRAAALLQKLCAGASMPNSVRVTRFAPTHMPNPGNKKSLARIMATMDASDGKEILERQPVWINPDGTVLSIRDASSRQLVAEAKLKAKEVDHRRQVRGEQQRRYRKKKEKDGNSANIAPSAGTLHSPTISEQTSSSTAAHFQRNPTAAFVGMVPQQAPHISLDDLNGPHGIPKQNSQKLQTHKSRRANSGGNSNGSRGLFPLPGYKSLNSEASHDKLTPSRTLQRFPDYRQVPDAATQTSSPRGSNGPLSPSLTDWSQHQNYAAPPHRPLSSTFDPQTLGQYFQASDLPDFDTTTALPHQTADYIPNSNYRATPTNFVPGPFTVPHSNPSYSLPQEQMYQPSLYRHNPFDYGLAGSVPQIGSTDQSGRSIPTEAMAHYDPTGWIGNSQNQSYHDNSSEEDITLALGNTGGLTPAPEFYSGCDVDSSESNNPQILLTCARVLQDEPELDWETPPR